MSDENISICENYSWQNRDEIMNLFFLAVLDWFPGCKHEEIMADFIVKYSDLESNENPFFYNNV